MTERKGTQITSDDAVSPVTVGQKITLEPETGDRLEGRLLVVGTFTDGAEKILLDQDF